jgi:hypothetical protein
LQLLPRLTIWSAAAWLLAGAMTATARTAVDPLSTADGAAAHEASDALSTRLDLATTPDLNISLTGGWSAADRSAWDLSRQLFLRADARVELADGRWLQTLYAGYTDQRQESRAGDAAGRIDVAKLSGATRLSVGTLHELRLSSLHTLSLGLQTRHDTQDAREQLRFGIRSDADLDASWTHSETRSHSALAESRIQLGRGGRLELGGAFEGLSGQRGLMLARVAGSYAGRSGVQVLAAVGLGFADPARLASALAPAAASGTPLVQPGQDPGVPRAWQVRASRAFAGGKLTLGAAAAQAHAQGRPERLGDLTAHLELGSADPGLRTRAERLESFVAFTPLPTARLELAYTLTAARIRGGAARGSAFSAHDELAVTRHAARASLTWNPLPASSLGLTLRYVGARHEDASSPALAGRIGITQGSYTACDVSFRHALGTRWRAFGQVQSILHRERPPGAAAPPPRLQGTLGIEATF